MVGLDANLIDLPEQGATLDADMREAFLRPTAFVESGVVLLLCLTSRAAVPSQGRLASYGEARDVSTVSAIQAQRYADER